MYTIQKKQETDTVKNKDSFLHPMSPTSPA